MKERTVYRSCTVPVRQQEEGEVLFNEGIDRSRGGQPDGSTISGCRT